MVEIRNKFRKPRTVIAVHQGPLAQLDSRFVIVLLAVALLVASLPNSGRAAENPGQLAAPEATTAAINVLTAASAASMAMPEISGEIERNGESRLFYRTIKIPANAETLYLSGTGASARADGTWGNMEEQAIDTFNKFKGILEEEGWSMSDIVQVRVFAVAGEFGLLDFDGFNRGYLNFFGTEENPMKPVRSFLQVAALVNPNWLIEIEIRAARVPGSH